MTGNVIGFCNLGKVNDELLQYERDEGEHPPVAKHILAVMVRGLFFKCDFPLAHFSTEVATETSCTQSFGRVLGW